MMIVKTPRSHMDSTAAEEEEGGEAREGERGESGDRRAVLSRPFSNRV